VLSTHPLIRAKVAQRRLGGKVLAMLWSYLQNHSSPESETVKVTTRSAPFVFDKTASSAWLLMSDWKELDPEAAELSDRWKAGPGSAGEMRRYRMVTFHPSYSYEDFVIGLRPVAAADGTTTFRRVDGVFKQVCEEARANPGRRYALFMDEINRANIAKVFGELITLIEPDKRARYTASGNLLDGLEVQLPGTGGDEAEPERFGVPANLDLYGSMNTADRSIALLDIALRRRFEFEEIGPDYRVIDRSVEGVHLGRLLAAINDRVEFLADRDRRIGHAYFTSVDSMETLRAAFRAKVIPLLQEYFFDDWARVERVLATDGDRSRFIRRDVIDAGRLWPSAGTEDAEPRSRYEVSPPAEWDAPAFAAIYATG
jgi:5-methylcytosine-specific restriction protein B